MGARALGLERFRESSPLVAGELAAACVSGSGDVADKNGAEHAARPNSQALSPTALKTHTVLEPQKTKRFRAPSYVFLLQFRENFGCWGSR